MSQKNLFITISILVAIAIVGALMFSSSPSGEEQMEDTTTQEETTQTKQQELFPVEQTQNTVPPVPSQKEESVANLIRYMGGGFSPDIIEIRRGDEITFRNDINKELLVSARSSAENQAFAFPDSPLLLEGNSWTLTITAPVGTYSFVNTYNDSHIGVLVVQPQ